MEAPRSAYLALAELSRRWRAVGGQPASDDGPPAPLTSRELRAFSQNGEDGVLAEVFRRIGVTGGGFVEFGVETGREGNSVFLADVLEWSGLFIEGDPDSCHHLMAKYRWSDRVRVIHDLVTPDNVETLFAAGSVPAEPDLMSIDVDGQDAWIWLAVRAHRPRVVIIEYNAVIDPQSTLLEPLGMEGGWRGTDYYGASLGALVAVGDRLGYRLVHTEIAGVNAFFVRNDLAGPFAPDPPRRGPNYFLTANGHPIDDSGRTYVELPAPD